mmetsp:Transcript_9593/g.21239  ORF Transcript_9593/g.21239 Transcript_9593/m.21239 type:complete len:206 (+) Transcript_9593:250-867(+)
MSRSLMSSRFSVLGLGRTSSIACNTWSLVSTGATRFSTKEPASWATCTGTSTRVLRWVDMSDTNSATSLKVYSAGPASWKVLPSKSSCRSTMAMSALPTSFAKTGCTSALPSFTRGKMNGILLNASAVQLVKRSSAPKTVAGRTIIELGNTSRTAASPAALVRLQWLLASGSADIALMWMNVCTPASLQTSAIARGMSTCTSCRL